MNSSDVAALHRSSVHILLSDKDSASRKEVLKLLRTCSYQVTPVEHARQALDVLRSGGPPIDLILADVELPKGKGYKMLKHIMKEEKLKDIPVIMMSSKDEVTIVVKCLHLGAADFLMKPLRTNELLNLWTHMWRKKKACGLLETRRDNGLNINNLPLDLLLQEPSESNTTSTDLFSEETEEKKKTDQSLSFAPVSPFLELSLKVSADTSHLHTMSDVERKSNGGRTNEGYISRALSSQPRKAGELRIGQSSAFVSFCEASKERLATAEKAHRTVMHNGTHYSGHQGQMNGTSLKESVFLSSACAPDVNYTFAVDSSHARDSDVPELTSEHCRRGDSPPETSRKESSYGRETPSRDAEDMAGTLRSSPMKNVYSRQEAEKWARDEYGFRSADRVASSCFQRDAFAADQLGDHWRRSQSSGDHMVPSRFPASSPFSILKMNIPPDMIPEMGAMLPPPIPSHISLRHLMPPQISSGVSPLPCLPQTLHPSALVGIAPINPLYHGGMMQSEAAAIAVPSPALLGSLHHHHHHLGIHGHPFSLYPPPVIPSAPAPQVLRSAGHHHLMISPQGPPWPAMQIPINDRKLELAERREAALNKFRQKRKDRCFEKKIRYVSRKRLAEQRPRNRGQFVKQAGNGGKSGEDDSEDEEEYYEEDENDSSPECSSKASGKQRRGNYQ